MAESQKSTESFIVCKNSQGAAVRGVCLRMTRYVVSFEVYNPFSILQISEVLVEFQIFIRDRGAYSGRAVVSAMVNTGTVLVCEATLEEDWLDIDVLDDTASPLQLRSVEKGSDYYVGFQITCSRHAYVSHRFTSLDGAVGVLDAPKRGNETSLTNNRGGGGA